MGCTVCGFGLDMSWFDFCVVLLIYCILFLCRTWSFKRAEIFVALGVDMEVGDLGFLECRLE